MVTTSGEMMNMPTQLQRIRISDHSELPYKSSIIVSAIIAFAISFMIMGTAFVHFFVGLFVLSVLFFWGVYALTRPTNWFEFDDVNKMIVKPFRNRIPYNKIRAIVISENFKGTTINVKTNWMSPFPIASVSSKDDAEIAEKEFRQRFPPDIIRREIFSKKRRRILIAIISIVFIIWLSYLLQFMYRTEPMEIVTPEKKAWLAVKQPQTGTHYIINGFDFVLPDRFAKVKEEKSWKYFEDNLSKIKVNVSPGVFYNSDIKQRLLFGYLMGIRNDYDFFRLAYTARLGLIPSLNNSHAFKELFDIKLYEIDHGELHGIVLQGMKGNKSVAEIIVADKERGLHFFLSQPGEIGRINEELLQSIVASL